MNYEIFDKRLFKLELEELVKDINSVLDEIAPDGKTNKDFTGGYIQQLQNSNQFVAYFGQKGNTKNRDTVKVNIQADELDLFYVMLKAKIHEMKQSKTKTVTVSMAKRKYDKLGEWGE